LLYLKLYLKSCKNLLGKPEFPSGVVHNLRYDFEVRFQGHLEYTPSRRRQKLSTTSVHALSPPPLVMPSAAQLPCVMSSTPLLSSCHPPPNRLTVISPFSPCLAFSTPPSHHVVRRPPAFLFDWCVLDWWNWDVILDPMSCVVRPFPLTVLFAARLLCVL
jgi:hypothetical protein